MAQGTFERDRRGYWYPGRLKPSPLSRWPLQPAAVLRHIFLYPGMLFPWTAVYLAIGVATWYLLMPEMAAMRQLAPGWIVHLLLLNYALYIGWTGAWHYRLYSRRAQGDDYKYDGRWPTGKDPSFSFGSQLRDNLFWSLATGVPVCTLFEAATFWAVANGHVATISWQDHPVYNALLVFGVLVFREVHFYLIHRLIHIPFIYRHVHHVHHRNVNPGPWSGLSMHPVEQVLFFSSVLIHWVVPSDPSVILFHLLSALLGPSQGHSGFYKVRLGEEAEIPVGFYFHYLHHRYIECNYGSDGAVMMDKFFGTYHDGSSEATTAMNERLRARR